MVNLAHIAVASCVLLVGGCVDPSRSSSTPASSSRIVAADEDVLTVGMGLGDALEMITRHHVVFEIDRGEWVPGEDVAAVQRFVIERYDVDDALFIVAESRRGEKMRVRSLYWWRNYQEDSNLAKGGRKHETVHVESVPMTEIKRRFAYWINP